MIRMSNEISLEDAYRILADVMPDQCFWVNNGPVVRNLHEMSDALAGMNDATFMHHINGEKNDVRNWVRDVLNDEELVIRLAAAKSKEKVLREIQSRIRYLEKKIEKEGIT